MDNFQDNLRELVESFPYIVLLAPHAMAMGKNESKRVLVPTDEGEEYKDFNKDEWNMLLRLFVQRLKWLGNNRTPARAGTKRAPPPQILYLGKELRDFIKNNKDAFTIIDEEVDSNGKTVEVERDPFAKGGLKHLLDEGLALQSTVAGLLRAYNANKALYENSTLNKNRAEAGEKLHKGIVAADDTMKEELKGIFERLGKYYKETREEREKRKAARRGKSKVARKTANRVPMTKKEISQGFDPDQFAYGSTLQSITKLGRKYAEGEEGANYADPNDVLSSKEAKTLDRLKKERDNDPLYQELKEEEARTTRKTVEEKEDDEASDEE